MTDTGPLHARPGASPKRDPHSELESARIEPTDVSGWVGWIFFAAIVMILVGGHCLAAVQAKRIGRTIAVGRIQIRVPIQQRVVESIH